MRAELFAHRGKQGWLRPKRQRSVSMVASSSGTSASGESADDKVGKGVLSDVGGVVGTQGPAGEATDLADIAELTEGDDADGKGASHWRQLVWTHASWSER